MKSFSGQACALSSESEAILRNFCYEEPMLSNEVITVPLRDKALWVHLAFTLIFKVYLCISLS